MSHRATQHLDQKDTHMYYAVQADQGRIFRKVLETIAATAATMMGLLLLSGGLHSWDSIFKPMSLVADAAYWGALMIALSVVRMFVIIVNGYWPHSHKVRQWLSFMFIFGVWLPLGACFWWHAIYSESYTYPGMAYAIFTLGTEFLIFYAHSTFVYAIKRG